MGYLEHEQGMYVPVAEQQPKPSDNWPYSSRPSSPNYGEYGVKAPKFERHIFIRRDQLFFDIDSQLAILADARPKDDGTPDETISGASEKFRSMFYRWVDTHIGEAKTTLSAFTLVPFNTTAMNNIKDNDEVDITLAMPEWYDDTTFPQLCDAVHNYVVSATLFDFFSMRLTAKDAVTATKGEEKIDYKNKIRELANAAKPGRIKKPLKPF